MIKKTRSTNSLLVLLFSLTISTAHADNWFISMKNPFSTLSLAGSMGKMIIDSVHDYFAKPTTKSLAITTAVAGIASFLWIKSCIRNMRLAKQYKEEKNSLLTQLSEKDKKLNENSASKINAENSNLKGKLAQIHALSAPSTPGAALKGASN